jgi:predicted phosphoadenosine phosphosulfate sulfurtransferase
VAKKPLDYDVETAARKRISEVFDDFPKIYLSFSGGKDSSVMMHLVCEEARRRNRRIGVLFVDLEAQYKLTIDHIVEMLTLYEDCVDRYWVALPLNLRNAVSQHEPHWTCWDKDREADWVRPRHQSSIGDYKKFPFFHYKMEFEEFVPEFGHWYGDGKLTACFVGIRCDESLNRYRTIASRTKTTFEKRQYTTWCGKDLYNVYPIFDWRTEDIWTYNGKRKKCYNRLYDLMHQAGLTIHQARICQPYGDDQRKGLWLYHVIEPETWGRVVARVTGANQGAVYAHESGNILGNMKITKPAGHTWQSFAMFLLSTMPPNAQEQYKNKIAVFLKWYQDRGYPNGIPDFADAADEAAKKAPTWRRICKALLRNDYWCKGLSFSQHKSPAFEKYKKLMKKRREEWKII